MDLLKDFQFAVRQMAAKPLLSILAIISLALGVGVNSSIFSLVNAILLRGLPVQDPDRMVAIYTSGSDGLRYSTSSFPDFRDLREQNRVLSGLAAYSAFIAVNETESGTQPLLGEVVSGNFFDVLGVKPALGRSFLPEEDRTPGTHPVVMLGYRFWQDRFGGDPQVLGRTLTLNGTPLTVVGVTPAEMVSTFPVLKADFWLPLQMNDALSQNKILDQRGHRSLFLMGRLRDGVSVDQAESELALLGGRLSTQYPESNKDRKVTVVASRDVRLNPEIDGALVGTAGVLMVLVGLVLLIASSNIANLLLARANDRRKEITVRLAVGASRGRLIRQLLTESVLLALCSGILGLLIAYATTRLLVGFKPPLGVPVSLEVGLDARVLIFTLALAVATGVICGLAPAIQASRLDLASMMKDGSATLGRTYRKLGLRNLLVVSQVAVSTVLLIGAALFVHSLSNARSVDPGFTLRRGAVIDFNLGLGRKYGTEEGRNFLLQMVERIQDLPGVRSAAVAGHLPLGVTVVSEEVQAEGQPAPAGGKLPEIDMAVVGPGYFETLGVPLVQGRAFGAHDDAGGPGVVIVNATAARRFWPNGPAVGKRIKVGKEEGWLEVVGVAADGKYRSLGEEPRPFFYRPYLQSYTPAMTLLVSAEGDEAQALRAVRGELSAMDPTLPVFSLKTMSQHLSIMLFPARMGAWLLAAFGLLGLILASVGLYGVVSYSVAKRTREVGVRMAIGAHRQQILKLVLGEGMTLVAVGMGLGIVFALGVSRVLKSLLYGIGQNDPAAFLGVPLLLAGVSFLAIVIPARRAMRVDPMVALRYE